MIVAGVRGSAFGARRFSGSSATPGCQAREHCIHSFVDSVARETKGRRDRGALGVEEHRIFGGRRKHAAFFEPDDIEMRAPGIASLLEPARIEMPGARPLRRHLQRLDALANEPQRLGQRARERSKRAQLAQIVHERRGGAMIEPAAAGGRPFDELEGGRNDCL